MAEYTQLLQQGAQMCTNFNIFTVFLAGEIQLELDYHVFSCF